MELTQSKGLAGLPKPPAVVQQLEPMARLPSSLSVLLENFLIFYPPPCLQKLQSGLIASVLSAPDSRILIHLEQFYGCLVIFFGGRKPQRVPTPSPHRWPSSPRPLFCPFFCPLFRQGQTWQTRFSPARSSVPSNRSRWA